jgi:alkylation response protein AidB-like acyl-CoA dehydrogenase
VYETLAAAEPSVAWIVWNNSLVCWLARYLPAAERRAIFAEPKNLFASSTRPSGVAAREGEGYRISGRWSLVSGCLHARWIPVMCRIESAGEVEMLDSGQPRMRMFFIPRERFEIIDTWHVGGLRGTGSHDVVLEGEPATAERSAAFSDESLLDSPFGRVPIGVTLSAGCAAICLGIANAALSELERLGRTKVTPSAAAVDIRDRTSNQATVARTRATLTAWRTHLAEAYGRIWRAAEAARAPSLELLADSWSATVSAALTCRTALTEIYAAAGTSALYVDNPIERAHRDIHAVAQHVILQPSWLEEAGRVRLGLVPGHPLFAV